MIKPWEERKVVRIARGYSVESHSKHTRDVMALLVLEDSQTSATPSVMRTPTTEFLVELEVDKRTVYGTAVGQMLYMFQA